MLIKSRDVHKQIYLVPTGTSTVLAVKKESQNAGFKLHRDPCHLRLWDESGEYFIFLAQKLLIAVIANIKMVRLSGANR